MMERGPEGCDRGLLAGATQPVTSASRRSAHSCWLRAGMLRCERAELTLPPETVAVLIGRLNQFRAPRTVGTNGRALVRTCDFLPALWPAGLLGALGGLGGGVVIVPVLTIFFHVDIHYAIGASLVSVIATSSGAAAAYVREGFSNIRVGMFLEIATTLGALVGAWLTTQRADPARSASSLAWCCSIRRTASLKTQHEVITERSRQAGAAAAAARYVAASATGEQRYVAQRVPAGFG